MGQLTGTSWGSLGPDHSPWPGWDTQTPGTHPVLPSALLLGSRAAQRAVTAGQCPSEAAAAALGDRAVPYS